MEEEFITFETAKLAKVKGFDTLVNTYYYEDLNKNIKLDNGDGDCEFICINHNKYDGLNSRPTQSLLQRWLREKHNIFIEVTLDQTSYPKFAVEIYKYTDFGNYDKIIQDEWFLYRSYEEALEKGLQEALKINKNIMEKEEQNLNNPQNSALNITDVSSSIFKPLCIGKLNELKDKIYKEQFFDYDETVSCEKVLEELQNLKNNPKLLDYVIKCLANQEIATIPNKFYAVVVNAELRMEYDEKIHGTFEKYKQFCLDGNFGLKKRDHLLPKVYNGIGDIENEMMKSKGDEIIGFGNTKYQKYSIHELGVVAV